MLASLFFLPSSLQQVPPKGWPLLAVSWPRGEGGAEEERQEEREFQVGSMLSMEPNMGLNLMTLRSWPEPKSRVGCSAN